MKVISSRAQHGHTASPIVASGPERRDQSEVQGPLQVRAAAVALNLLILLALHLAVRSWRKSPFDVWYREVVTPWRS